MVAKVSDSCCVGCGVCCWFFGRLLAVAASGLTTVLRVSCVFTIVNRAHHRQRLWSVFSYLECTILQGV